MTTHDDLRTERDALGFLGVLSHAYLTWDPPVSAGTDSKGKPDFTHYAGLNIHALVLDNVDGEVLGIERNLIHEAEDPTRHAEQAAIRTAIGRLRTKRPRGAGVSVEKYYRSQLFYDAGNEAEDYVRKGCTLYTTLEPCPMCTTTICVCRMKRSVFIIGDKTFGGSWGDAEHPGIKDRFYSHYDLAYGPFQPVATSPIASRAAAVHGAIAPAIEAMRAAGVQDTWFLDRLHAELRGALDALTELTDKDVSVGGADRAINVRTLKDLKRLCRLPS